MSGPEPGTKVVALFDFKGASKEDLPFRRGEALIVQQLSEDPNWWFVKNSKGKKGMIPANYVNVLDDRPKKDTTLPRDDKGQLIGGPMPWFHGKISRDRANQMLLKAKAPDGVFLIRESTNYPGDYTLCVRSGVDQVDHYHIKSINGRITVDEESTFRSLDDLIQHYYKEADGLAHKLVTPLVREDGKELIDKKAFEAYEINPRELYKGKLLGSGQFGEVYEGTFRGVKVAIKTLKNINEDGLREFLAEANVMIQLKDKNLVSLIGVVTKAGEKKLVTEFLEKGNLLDFLRSRGRSVVTPKMQHHFTRDICNGMAYLEKRKVVHRDLAARNVLISADDVAKVADFGLARVSTAGVADPGKLPIKWTAPEVLRQKVSTSKSDVWSFGVTVWEIYSFGRTPYPRMSQKEVVEKVAKGYRMEKPEDCPEVIYEIMQKCWHIEPLQRPTFNSLKKTLAKRPK
ncbi:TK protein kinase [Salpingoeca rosetta]|uniref:non-specific protein-tyrosine kinase n=1 Tax=Salpingoeca rosetta (strain ATCC 50818 / BSB-021) TaxID=946362 RepID=F2UI96_SALR5|nr:TK protein kinase [Salpingoeca rosetta]EGD76845.1 TK protein kinase [Salpingoeca rosetta]|eukprot:XP_004991217.1 TK protein kinase [Salpingoeca rosetta]